MGDGLDYKELINKIGGLIMNYEMKEDWIEEYEITPTIQTQLNVIQQIRYAINCMNVKVEFFSEEFCVSLYDSEIPICWDKQNGLYLLTETMNGDITHDMMVEILSVMDIIRDNLNWFTEILGQAIAIDSWYKVNEYSFNPNMYEIIERDAIDLYPYLRDSYNQKRETDEVIITIGNHLATEQVFKSEEEAQKVIDATDWNLVAALIYACKEADRWEEEQKK